MSFCPSKDIHSVYLDGELPEVYKAEYESHLKICPTCQKELDKIKALRGIFQAARQRDARRLHRHGVSRRKTRTDRQTSRRSHGAPRFLSRLRRRTDQPILERKRNPPQHHRTAQRKPTGKPCENLYGKTLCKTRQ